MRAIWPAFLLIVLAALGWAARTPIGALWNVSVLKADRGDVTEAEDALIKEGPGALPFLQRGLRSASPVARFRCAKVLLILGESDGESFLLNELRAHPDVADSEGLKAEGYLIAAWDQREGPTDTYRKKLRDAEHTSARPIETIQVISECLTRFPNWADGFARRARMYQMAGEAYEAKRDALAALALAPNHFEALVTLGKVQLAVEAPYHAFKCFERAVLVNPRLKSALKSDMLDALRSIETEKAKQREERRRNAVLV